MQMPIETPVTEWRFFAMKVAVLVLIAVVVGVLIVAAFAKDKWRRGG
jgi:hypothetical protein